MNYTMNYTYLRFPGFARRAVTFSYDDGIVQDRKLVEIFRERGLRATFNLSSALLGNEGYIAKEEVKDLYAPAGMEVAAHGAHHLSLTEVPDPVATDDVLSCKKDLEDLLGTRVPGMAYANGAYDDRVENILLRSGVAYSRTVKATHGFGIPEDFRAWHPTCHHDDREIYDLVEKFFADGSHEWYFWGRTPRLLYIWGHSYEFDRHDNWDRIEKIADAVAGKSGVWYATNGEICDYVTAYSRLEFSANGKFVYNPTSTDVCLSVFVPALGNAGKDVLAKAGEVTEI